MRSLPPSRVRAHTVLRMTNLHSEQNQLGEMLRDAQEEYSGQISRCVFLCAFNICVKSIKNVFCHDCCQKDLTIPKRYSYQICFIICYVILFTYITYNSFLNISHGSSFQTGFPVPEILNRIAGVMVSVLDSSAVDRGFEPRSCQIKDYKIGICCFFAKHTALRRKSKGWLARNQDNVSEQGDMSIRGLLFQ